MRRATSIRSLLRSLGIICNSRSEQQKIWIKDNTFPALDYEETEHVGEVNTLKLVCSGDILFVFISQDPITHQNKFANITAMLTHTLIDSLTQLISFREELIRKECDRVVTQALQ